MKKTLAAIAAAFILASNVYAKEVWFVLSPCVDNTGEKVNDKYKNTKEVQFDFKIFEIIDKLIKSY